MNEYRHYYRRHLPHYQPAGATLFVTIRLARSLPYHVIGRLAAEARQFMTVLNTVDGSAERAAFIYREYRRAFGRWDTALDKSMTGPAWLRQGSIAAIVAESLHWRHGRVYVLLAYCIMPNHVHLVIRVLPDQRGVPRPLESILHSLKRFTAGKANQLLGRQGAFWQRESYDHVIRDAGELERIIAYVRNNPVKAGLVDQWQEWPYTYVAEL